MRVVKATLRKEISLKQKRFPMDIGEYRIYDRANEAKIGETGIKITRIALFIRLCISIKTLYP